MALASPQPRQQRAKAKPGSPKKADPRGAPAVRPPSMFDVYFLPDLEELQDWAAALGVSWDAVLSGAGIITETGGRATKARLKKGGAPAARTKLFAWLLECERRRTTKTEIGARILNTEAWADLGRRLGVAAPDELARRLQGFKEVVELYEAARGKAAEWQTGGFADPR